jgi:decaprenylphospho-beta-D-erythro-pentofuranosid-2-ulose 2-reductase
VIDGTGRPGRVLLLGGSSDIGLACVRRLFGARRGDVVLAGRPGPGLDAAADQLRAAGHRVTSVPFDAREPTTHEEVLTRAFADGDVDVVLLAFGLLGDAATLLDDPLGAVEVATVNYVGGVSVGIGVAARLRAQGHGHLVVLSSIAAVRPRANVVYGSSKAGLDAFARGLGDRLAGSGVHVTVVRPGFVRTRMTRGLPEAPFATDADTVAVAVADAVRTRRRTVWVPAPVRWVALVLRVLPASVLRRLPR